MSATLWVHGWAAWLPSHPTAAAWSAQLPQPPLASPAATLLPARARGRASMLTRMLAEVTQQATAHAGIAASEPVLLFGSAYGEVDTSLALLERVVEGDVVSPVRFQSSVHSAGVSQVAIHTANRRFCSALCAGSETFAMALFEARAWLARHGGFALVAVADERTPELVAPEHAFTEAAAALCIGTTPSATGRTLALSGPTAPGTASSTVARADLPPALILNPSAWALPCVAALERDQRATLALDPEARWLIHV